MSTNTKSLLSGLFMLKVFLVTLFVFFINSNQQIELTQNVLPQTQNTCSGVLTGMMTGTWKTRPLTKQEQDDISAFLKHVYSPNRVPSTYQRDDGLCGNVTYLESKSIRAVCDSKGKTPCCFHNKCASKTAAECKCEECYDMRNEKHAEYSKWIPSDPLCSYHEHTPEEACNILDGMDIAFVGDSLMRHFYTAFLLVVTGKMKDGALKPNADKDARQLCQGMHMFTEKTCRGLVKTPMETCRGRVKLSLYYYFKAEHGPRLYSIAKNTTKSLLFIGIGAHDNFNHSKVQNMFLKPTLRCLKTYEKKAPKILWASHHAPGILKSPIYWRQAKRRVKAFNKRMESFFQPWNISIFDTYRVTEGMRSFDGTHFGMGMNVCKANLLLSYIKEQRIKGNYA